MPRGRPRKVILEEPMQTNELNEAEIKTEHWKRLAEEDRINKLNAQTVTEWFELHGNKIQKVMKKKNGNICKKFVCLKSKNIQVYKELVEKNLLKVK